MCLSEIELVIVLDWGDDDDAVCGGAAAQGNANQGAAEHEHVAMQGGNVEPSGRNAEQGTAEQGTAEPTQHRDQGTEQHKQAKPSKGDLEAMKKRALEKDPAAMEGRHSAAKDAAMPSTCCIPFPSRFTKSKRAKSDEEVLDVFRKVNVNIPLLECIKQVPKYAKFLKELCTTRRHTRERKVMSMSETVSAVLQRKMPPKLKDPGSFSIPVVIGTTRFEKVMLDLGASINVMPYSVYLSLGLGPLQHDDVVIQLADRSSKYPKGYVEDVLVQVNHLIFPADFYVLEMEESVDSTQLLLGRPFMRTARTNIDVAGGNLTMEFDGEVIKFNIFDAMRHPSAIQDEASSHAEPYCGDDATFQGEGRRV